MSLLARWLGISALSGLAALSVWACQSGQHAANDGVNDDSGGQGGTSDRDTGRRGGSSGDGSGPGGATDSGSENGGQGAAEGGASTAAGGAAESQGGTSLGGGTAGRGAAGAGQGGASAGQGGTNPGGNLPLFYEGFDSGLKSWSLGPSSASRTIGSGTSGGPGLQISGNEGAFSGLNRAFSPPIKPSAVTFWMRVASSAGSAEADFALSGNTSATTHVVWLALAYNDYGTSKTIDVVSHADAASWQVDSTTNPSIAVDTWLHFTLAIDWNAKTYDVSLNGTPIGPHNAFSAAYFERIDLWANQGLVYFDEIEMLP